jgi:hypothetical protein
MTKDRPGLSSERVDLARLRWRDQQQQSITDLSPRQRGRYKITNPQQSKENVKKEEKLVTGPVGLTTRLTGRLTVGPNVTSTSTRYESLPPVAGTALPSLPGVVIL